MKKAAMDGVPPPQLPWLVQAPDAPRPLENDQPAPWPPALEAEVLHRLRLGDTPEQLELDGIVHRCELQRKRHSDPAFARALHAARREAGANLAAEALQVVRAAHEDTLQARGAESARVAQVRVAGARERARVCLELAGRLDTAYSPHRRLEQSGRVESIKTVRLELCSPEDRAAAERLALATKRHNDGLARLAAGDADGELLEDVE